MHDPLHSLSFVEIVGVMATHVVLDGLSFVREKAKEKKKLSIHSAHRQKKCNLFVAYIHLSFFLGVVSCLA